jgi:AbrB family looped-hinge helix DNA binding protein
METTKLSSKGQVIIPKHIRAAHHWDAGLELKVIDFEEGVLLKPKAPFPPTTLDQVGGCLSCVGEAKSDADIEAVMQQAARKAWRDGN